MKKITPLLFVALLFVSCNSVKRNQRFIAQGNYDTAIELAVKKLQKNSHSSKADEHIVLLEEAYKKAVDKDKRNIKYFQKSDNPDAPREIYYTYVQLRNRQDLIRPLLPLSISSLNRNAKFKFEDYSDEIAQARKVYEVHLYDIGKNYMSYNTKDDYRKAYTVFCELTDINPNYRDTKQLRDEAHYRGTDFVLVAINNYSGILIPYRLEEDLLNFNTYGLDDFWTEYHSEPQNNIDYTYGIDLNFRVIEVSPEKIFEKSFHREKEVKTGWKYKKDRNGNIVKDENGMPIKIDIFETVEAEILITTQSKATHVVGEVIYRNLLTGRELNNFPLETEFIFENVFATYTGNKKALTKDDLKIIKNEFVPFPSSEQMVYDAGEAIKEQLKRILNDNNFR